jgi:ABC-2 type transport system ATP-binding protein
MILNGRVVLVGPLDQVKESHHQLTLRFESAQARPPALTGALSITGAGHEWSVVCNGARNELAAAAAKLGARIVAERSPSLDEIFVARASRKADATREAL